MGTLGKSVPGRGTAQARAPSRNMLGIVQGPASRPVRLELQEEESVQVKSKRCVWEGGRVCVHV